MFRRKTLVVFRLTDASRFLVSRMSSVVGVFYNSVNIIYRHTGYQARNFLVGVASIVLPHIITRCYSPNIAQIARISDLTTTHLLYTTGQTFPTDQIRRPARRPRRQHAQDCRGFWSVGTSFDAGARARDLFPPRGGEFTKKGPCLLWRDTSVRSWALTTPVGCIGECITRRGISWVLIANPAARSAWGLAAPEGKLLRDCNFALRRGIFMLTPLAGGQRWRGGDFKFGMMPPSTALRIFR